MRLLLPSIATLSIAAHELPESSRRSLRPEPISNDNKQYITVNDDGITDDNNVNDAKNHGPLKLFQHVDFSIASHFKGWPDLPLNNANSNDIELSLVDAETGSKNLTQHNFNGANNRFCGTTFDNAVDTHCYEPTSCQFQRCPGGMTCYVLSEGVMSWCLENKGETTEELQSNEVVMGSSEPTEGWSEMPAEKPTDVSFPEIFCTFV